MTRQQRWASVSAGRSSEGIPHRAPTPHDSSGHLPAVNSRSCPGIALQSPSPSSQSPLGHPSLSRYVVLWEGLSAWFSFHAAGHGCAAALSRSLRCQPSVLNSLADGGLDPCFGPPCPTCCLGCRPGPAQSPPSPSFLHPPGFCVDLNIPLRWPGTLASSQLLPCEILHIRGCVPEESAR